jgi:hypothetical protein
MCLSCFECWTSWSCLDLVLLEIRTSRSRPDLGIHFIYISDRVSVAVIDCDICEVVKSVVFFCKICVKLNTKKCCLTYIVLAWLGKSVVRGNLPNLISFWQSYRYYVVYVCAFSGILSTSAGMWENVWSVYMLGFWIEMVLIIASGLTDMYLIVFILLMSIVW